MSDRGKYHGHRLKAKDVLRLYASGERDFRGAILRGCNFQNAFLRGCKFDHADLSETNFSRADICSVQFDNANMIASYFFDVNAGIRQRWFLVQLLLIGAVAALAGIMQGYGGGTISYFLLTISNNEPHHFATVITSSSLKLLAFGTILTQGFTIKAVGFFTVSVAFGIVAAIVLSILVSVSFAVAATMSISISVA